MTLEEAVATLRKANERLRLLEEWSQEVPAALYDVAAREVWKARTELLRIAEGGDDSPRILSRRRGRPPKRPNTVSVKHQQPTIPLDSGREVVLKTKDVLARVKVGRTTLWKLEREGVFPKRRNIAPGMSGWLESDIDAWLRALPVVREGV